MNALPDSKRHRLFDALDRLFAGMPITMILLLVSAVALAWPEAAQVFQYDRAAISGGQLWRVLTGHLAHWNLDHWFWDATMFGLLGAMCQRRGRRRYAVCLLASAVLISVSVWHLSPEMPTYRGLSGIDSALFGLLAALMLREQRSTGNRRQIALVVSLVLGFAAKIGYELLSAQTVFVDADAANFVPVPVAHIVGFAVGAITGAVRDFRFDRQLLDHFIARRRTSRTL